MTPKKFLQITAYPPPRCGWGVRVQFLKRRLEVLGHSCAVLNIGPGRRIPSDEYEMVLGGWDYLRKVWRYSRAGFVAHVHTNGKSWQGLILALAAEAVNLAWGRRCVLTFHAGEEQVYFPRRKAPLLAPVFWVLFTIPRTIICNNAAVRAGIAGYGISPDKISPIPAFSRQYLEFERVSLGPELDAFYEQFAHVLFCYAHIQPTYHPQVLIDAFSQIVNARSDTGLVVCGLMGHRDEGLWQAMQASITAAGLRDRVQIVDDLDHDQFLTALERSTAYVRTTPEDGVSSSVLEALALRVPVVAAENRSRPPGVITYPAESAATLARLVLEALERREDIAAAMPTPELPDTVEKEVQLLLT